jgi:hypothetical protein
VGHIQGRAVTVKRREREIKELMDLLECAEKVMLCFVMDATGGWGIGPSMIVLCGLSERLLWGPGRPQEAWRGILPVSRRRSATSSAM